MQPDNQQNPQMNQPMPSPAMAGFQGAPNGNPVMTPSQPQSAQPQNTEPVKAGSPSSAQNALLFSEMRENMIIMQDGSFRAVIRCQSINFDLMSSREREGIEYSYQNFLNSLYFPIQILVRSRRIDITPYIDRLSEIRHSQDNLLLNVLMDDYIDFIDVLAQEANIMDKSFYIVVPYYPQGDMAEIKKQAKGLFDSFFGGNKEVSITKIDQPSYQKAKDEIKNRVDSVMSGLFQMGVKSIQLNTLELGELFYASYNPDTATRQPINNMELTDLTATYVEKGEGDTRDIGVRGGL